ncbi:acyl carrier protein [Idiomarina piscisalsi]|uniref:acyl carrier protein n=1 Tax=Idiomarina piscisalsi TaxID=1096243 RepID=UPI00137E572B|nr:acyl carrier protein [Idiomarina piscisalsi]MTJ01718.1 acyl carrier protein [Idiomarina piscisalsi]
MKTKDEVYTRLTQILEEDFEIESDDIALDANLYEDLDLDSIDAVDLVVKLREITGKKISPDAFKAVRTVEDVVNEVYKLVHDE